MTSSAAIVQRLWSYCKAQSKIRDPAKLRRLIELIDGATWAGLGIGRWHGPARAGAVIQAAA